jgi:hypothetical protein
MLQSAQPVRHMPAVHIPPTHAEAAWLALQAVAQAPQLNGSVVTSTHWLAQHFAGAAQRLSSVQPGTHAVVAPMSLHTWPIGQCASIKHGTHSLLALQYGVFPPQVLAHGVDMSAAGTAMSPGPALSGAHPASVQCCPFGHTGSHTSIPGVSVVPPPPLQPATASAMGRTTKARRSVRMVTSKAPRYHFRRAAHERQIEAFSSTKSA